VAAEAEAAAGGREASPTFGALTPPRPLRLIEDTTSE
jgi:hypothetical protein